MKKTVSLVLCTVIFLSAIPLSCTYRPVAPKERALIAKKIQPLIAELFYTITISDYEGFIKILDPSIRTAMTGKNFIAIRQQTFDIVGFCSDFVVIEMYRRGIHNYLISCAGTCDRDSITVQLIVRKRKSDIFIIGISMDSPMLRKAKTPPTTNIDK